MVDFFIDIKKGSFDHVLEKIRKRKYKILTANKKLNEIYLNFKGTNEKSREFKQIQVELSKIKGVAKVEIIRRYLKVKKTKLTDALATNDCRIIFDIDSTLTRGGKGTIHPSIPILLQKIQDRGIWVYVATGRSTEELVHILNTHPVQKKSIAENGGIILGFTTDGYLQWGHKDEPLKILDYLKKKYKVKEDMKHGERITEVIFSQKDVTREMIEEAKIATKARIEIHASENSFHISEEGVDKGTALLELAKRLNWGNAFKIGVGDSQLDVPLFNACDYSFAPKNCDKYALEACDEELCSNYEKAIAELYDLIDKT